MAEEQNIHALPGAATKKVERLVAAAGKRWPVHSPALLETIDERNILNT
jgi:hypothetical protein